VSDTPRTDESESESHIGISNFGHQDLYYAYKFARQLERELNAANERIQRLEEAGDAMVSHAKALGMDGTGLVKRWFKAKEAKP
jgi:hypothetical protein